MFIKFLIMLMLGAVLYRIITRFILPIVGMSRMVHQKMDAIKKQVDDMQQKPSKEERSKPRIDGEYIDYEEIK
jgi:hypothetical protein